MANSNCFHLLPIADSNSLNDCVFNNNNLDKAA